MKNYSYLNHYIPPSSEGLSDPWKRALGRLGDYTMMVVRAMNLRPIAVALYEQTEQHILVRISTSSAYYILRIAPEDDLAAYVYFVRTMSGQGMPGPQIIQRDLSRTLVPFAYTFETHVPGIAATQLNFPALLRGAGRQAGRVLRRMHRVHTPGAGRPNTAGRWPAQNWHDILMRIGQKLAASPVDTLLFGEPERAALSSLLNDPRLNCRQPVLIHGAFGPQAVRCTASEHVHLEGIVEPGNYVAGDGLYDLACGLCPVFPQAWREGLLEGYNAAGPLTLDEQERLPILRLISCAWLACDRYMRALPHEEARTEALRLLGELALV